MQITNHAILRYLERVLGKKVVNEKHWKSWKKGNKDYVQKLEKEIEAIFQDAIYITEETQGIHKDSKFYVNPKKMLTFVIKKNTILTIYPIDYGMDEEGNHDLYAVYSKTLHRLEKESQDYEASNGKTQKSLEDDIEENKQALQKLEAECQKKKAKLNELEGKLKNLRKKQDEVEEMLHSVRDRIIRSKFAD